MKGCLGEEWVQKMKDSSMGVEFWGWCSQFSLMRMREGWFMVLDKGEVVTEVRLLWEVRRMPSIEPPTPFFLLSRDDFGEGFHRMENGDENDYMSGNGVGFLGKKK
ncbi:hypothetical protein V6N13_108058 [Hibiscus sabdariffa]